MTSQAQLQDDSQIKLYLRTSVSKLQYKLTKARAISSQDLQNKIVPHLKSLAEMAIPNQAEPSEMNQSRQFERNLELARVMVGEMVRRDRHADVWEDLIGELGLLNGSIGRLVLMIDEVNLYEHQKQQQQQQRKAKGQNGGYNFWSFWTKPAQKPEENNETSSNDNNANAKQEDQHEEEDFISPLNQDRYIKIVRNFLVAEWFLGDEIKEFKKLKPYLMKSVHKELVSACTSKDGINDLEKTVKDFYKGKQMDLEDRTFMEIVKKLRGDDEEMVIGDYINEISDIYRIDLYATGKYDEEDEDEDDDEGEEGQEGDDDPSSDDADKGAKATKKSAPPKSSAKKPNSKNQPPKLDSKKKLNDLDELKKRFDDLKRL